MFLLQLLLTFQDIVGVADSPELIGDVLGLKLTLADWRHSTEWLAGMTATRKWAKGKLEFTPGCTYTEYWNYDALPICSVWYRFLIGAVILREDPRFPGSPEFSVRTLEQCLFALSGSGFLLIMR